jgi:hypothetical protein
MASIITGFCMIHAKVLSELWLNNYALFVDLFFQMMMSTSSNPARANTLDSQNNSPWQPAPIENDRRGRIIAYSYRKLICGSFYSPGHECPGCRQRRLKPALQPDLSGVAWQPGD